MKRVNDIMNHPFYRECLEKIELAECDRKFCKHDMNHFLDVARLATLFNFQENIGIEREIIYAAAMVHDIGRYIQYERGTPHEIASGEIAPSILAECSFTSLEIEQIIEAVENHRNIEIAEQKNLSGILYRGDKMSRSCFACKENKICNWEKDKKNLELKW